MRVYREEFQPSEQLDRPYVIAAVNVPRRRHDEESQRQSRRAGARSCAASSAARAASSPTRTSRRSCDSRRARTSTRCSPTPRVGTPDAVKAYLDEFRAHADADELIVAHQGDSAAARLRSLELVAETAGLVAA